jgi:hypothetical protein
MQIHKGNDDQTLRLINTDQEPFAELTDWRIVGDPEAPEPQGVLHAPKQPGSMFRGFIKPNRHARRRAAKVRLTKTRGQAQ